MNVDLTPATSLSTVAGYGLAPSRGILSSTAHIMPAGPASHSTEAGDQFSGRAEIGGDVHDEALRAGVGALREPAVINGGHGSEHCVEVQCTADEAVTTVASPLGERNLVNDHTTTATTAAWTGPAVTVRTRTRPSPTSQCRSSTARPAPGSSSPS